MPDTLWRCWRHCRCVYWELNVGQIVAAPTVSPCQSTTMAPPTTTLPSQANIAHLRHIARIHAPDCPTRKCYVRPEHRPTISVEGIARAGRGLVASYGVVDEGCVGAVRGVTIARPRNSATASISNRHFHSTYPSHVVTNATTIAFAPRILAQHTRSPCNA